MSAATMPSETEPFQAEGAAALRRRAGVLAATRACIDELACSEPQRRLLHAMLAGVDRPAADAPWLFFIDIPPLVFAAVTGDEKRAAPLAATTTLLYLGADILDDLADGDRPSHWQNWSPAEINLAAATIMSALLPLSLARTGASVDRQVALHRTLADGLLRMAAGQQADLAGHGRREPPRAGDVERAVAGKSGAEVATFAALAAQLAGAAPDVVERYTAMGRALGTAAQLASDCYELFDDPAARDLAHGVFTLPLAIHLERLAPEQRIPFMDILARARTNAAARDEVRRTLEDSGSLRHAAVVVEIHRQQAFRALASAAPREPAATELRALIDSVGFFPAKPVSPSVNPANA